MRLNGSKASLLVSLVIVIIGIALRVNVYFQDRSLVLDEANLARNIVERDYSGLFDRLDHGQTAPPLFSCMAKGLARIFGINEYAFRLPSLLAGFLSLVLLMLLVRELIPAYPVRWYVLLLLAFSIASIRYSTEFKQYALDGALTLLFILWAIRDIERGFDKAMVLKWSAAGMLSIWLSMPVVFVLAAIGLAFLIKTCKYRKSRFIPVLITCASWLVSFGLYYFLVLRKDIANEYLEAYHAPYFFSFIPADHASFDRSYHAVIDLFRSATDKTALSIVWAISMFITGGVYLLLKKRTYAFLLLTPVFFCLLASQFHLYSMIGRLTLFMIPLLMLTMGVGISFIWTRTGLAIKAILVIPMLISVFNKGGYEYLWKRMEFEDSKSVMRYLEGHRLEGELIYVQYDGIPAFVFYNEMYDRAWEFDDYYLAGSQEMPAKVIPEAISQASEGRFWLFFSHTYPQENIDRYVRSAQETGDEIGRFQGIQASAYYFRLK